jgi:hypothetical protein
VCACVLFAPALKAQVDTQAPTVPAGLTATTVSSSQIDLSWSASTDNVGVKYYNLFPDVSMSVSISGNATRYSFTGLAPSKAFVYSVQACDLVNNCSARSTNVVGRTASNGVMLSPVGGWNLMGNSSSATLDVVTLFGDATKVATVWKWLPSAGSWAFYTPTLSDGGAAYAQSKGYSALTKINAGEGFWVNAKTAFTAQLPDASPITSALTQTGFSTGWNLSAIGDSETPRDFNTGLSATQPAAGTIPSNVTTLWAWDALKGSWYFYAPSLDAKGGTALSDYINAEGYLDFTAFGQTLGPGVGFWVNYPAATTCSVSGTAGQGASVALTSISGDGVVGCPSTAIVNFAPGTTVPYSFSPAPGYASAMVMIDGVMAPSSGTLTMNANHWIWAFGNAQTGTQFTGMMTVPSDFTLIPYPQFYQNPPSFDFTVADPYCAMTAEVIAYPASYLGAFSLPPVNGAPLPASVRRGAQVHDVGWAPNGIPDPTQNLSNGCRGDMHTAFLATLARLKKLGADHVMVFRDTQLADANATQLQILPWASFSIPDSEMAWIAAQAKAFGLQVWEFRQLVGQDANNVMLPDTPTIAWATNFLDAYIQFIVDRATLAQQNGVEAFLLDWAGYKGVIGWDPARTVPPEIVSLFKSKITTAAQQVRSVFSGKIILGALNSQTVYDQTFLSNIDWMMNELSGANVSAAENMNMTVAMMKQKYLDDIASQANNLGDHTKPRVWTLKSESYRDYFVNGFVEDMFCVNGCMQKNLPTDFSVQAIAYEAMLEAVAQQTYFTTAAVTPASYLYTDVALPMNGMPNISFSWRNKPTESILYQWFKK